MSSGSEFHKSQFILWGRVIDFFFIVCFSFFSPPICQPSSTWIELFDLRAALLKEEETPPGSLQHFPALPCPVRIPSGQTPGTAGKGQALARTSVAGLGPPCVPSLAAGSHLLCMHPHSASSGPVYRLLCVMYSCVLFLCHIIHLVEALRWLPLVPAAGPPSTA